MSSPGGHRLWLGLPPRSAVSESALPGLAALRCSLFPQLDHNTTVYMQHPSQLADWVPRAGLAWVARAARSRPGPRLWTSPSRARRKHSSRLRTDRKIALARCPTTRLVVLRVLCRPCRPRERPHHTSLGGGNTVTSTKSVSQQASQPASRPAQVVFFPDNTKHCIFLQALSITCRNQSAATDPGPHLITALYVLRRTNFYREGIPCRCTQQLAGRAPSAPLPLPFSS